MAYAAMKSVSITASATDVRIITSLDLNVQQSANLAGLDISVQTNDALLNTDGSLSAATGHYIAKNQLPYRLTGRTNTQAAVVRKAGASDATVIVTAFKAE